MPTLPDQPLRGALAVRIPLKHRRGASATVLIDAADHERVMAAGLRFNASQTTNAPLHPGVTGERADGGDQWLYLCNWLLGWPRGRPCGGHANGNAFDCRRANLLGQPIAQRAPAER
jgi:hypothetical protein